MFGLAVQLGACSHPAPAALDSASASSIELGEMTLLADGATMLALHASGAIEARGQTNGATLGADGSLTANGKVVLRLGGDGKVVADGQRVLPISIAGDTATIDAGRAQIVIRADADGSVQFSGGDPKAQPVHLRLTGADTPAKRRAMLLLLAILFGSEPTPVTLTPSASSIELGEMTMQSMGVTIAALHANGALEAKGQDTGITLGADGSITANGRVVLRLGSDGQIVADGHGVLPISIAGETATIHAGSASLVIHAGADGAVERSGGDPTEQWIHVQLTGADTPAKRRAMLLLLVILFGTNRTIATATPTTTQVIAPLAIKMLMPPTAAHH